MSQLQKYFEVTDPEGQVSRFRLNGGGPVVIGRDADAKHGLRLDSGAVSRSHAELTCDELGRWSIRDLGSRNGTYLNGGRIAVDNEDVHWEVLEPGDAVTIGGFRLVLSASSPLLDEAMGHELSFFNVTIDDVEGSEPVSSLNRSAVASIRSDQLDAVGSLGLRLVQTRDALKRLQTLFDFVLGEEMKGLVAMAMRIDKQQIAKPPRMLVKPKASERWAKGRRPHISRTAVLAVLGQGRGVVVGGAQTGGLELSIDSAAGEAVIACPLRSTDDRLDFLYLVLPEEDATTDWLALVSLACRQYEIAELGRALSRG